MSTSTGRKYDWLIIIPDKPGARETRLKVRQDHFKELMPKIEPQNLKMGGGLLNSVPKDDEVESLDFFGSTLVREAESREEIMEDLKKDIYATSGTWDMDKIQIYPFKQGFKMRG